MTRAHSFLLLAASVGVLSCSERVVTTGLTEPIAVRNAQFVEGELPGSAPLTSEEILAGVEPDKPSPQPVATEVSNLKPGSAGIRFFGVATNDSKAIGVRLRDEGTGYWLLPTGNIDLTAPENITYNFLLDFHGQLEPGEHVLEIASFDEEGRSGNRSAATICLNSSIPDNGNGCNPARRPPDLVISLGWDTPADLDLVVVTDTGKVVNSGDPTTAEPDENGVIDPTAAGVGNLDIDSNRDCVLDDVQRENLVFRSVPRNSSFKIYANLNRSCGEHSVRYQLEYYWRVPGKESGTWAVERESVVAGGLVAEQANGGAALGTFLTELRIGG